MRRLARLAGGRAAPWLALLLGVLHTAAFAPTGLWWLEPLALAGLFALACGAAPRRAAACGFAFGVGWLASGLWWLYISMHDYGGLPAPLAVAAVLLLAAFLALDYALALALAARLARGLAPRQRGRRALLLGSAWLLAELARATLFSGFPWIAGGYAHSVGPLAAFAPWVGVYGMSALAALLAAALALRAWRLLGGLAVLVAAAQFVPHEFTRAAGTLEVALVQPAVAQDLKFDPDLMDAHLEALARQIEGARGQFVVTPESVVPLPFAALDRDYLARLERTGRPLLLGGFLGDEKQGYVNSMAAFGAGADYAYGKRHLLPFGEFVPTGFHWFVDLLGIPMVDQARGTNTAPLVVAGQRLRPLICYESLFGEDFVASAAGPEAATIFVNVSNLAWFGTVMVQDQDLQFAQLRALEFQRPFVRATNTGATAVIDAAGRVTARLPAGVPGVLQARVEGRSGATPYARWLAACGLWPLFALALIGFIAAARGRRDAVH
ncbi:MAG: apolipoprotein N-acyltransferase [Pelomonas sp.]|nr:apolipoprotein N-acyltransferase [Roseateles sp.]